MGHRHLRLLRVLVYIIKAFCHYLVLEAGRVGEAQRRLDGSLLLHLLLLVDEL